VIIIIYDIIYISTLMLKTKDIITHNNLSPGFKRVLIVGSSGTGKSFSLPTLFKSLHKPNEIHFFSHNIDQDIYKHAVKQAYPKSYKKINIETYDEIPREQMMYDKDNRKEFKKNKHIIFVFDDINKKEMEKQLIPFFTISRHLNLSVILIYQRFYDIPLTIRLNSNLILIFRSSFGYDTLYNNLKLYFDNDKSFFDKVMDLLNMEKYKYHFISIDLDGYKNNLKINLKYPISYIKKNLL